MVIEFAAAIFTIISVVIVLAGYAFGIIKKWVVPPWRPSLRKWIETEVITLLTNDDTPVAVYAHEAREAAEKAAGMAEGAKIEASELHDDVREIRRDVSELHAYVRKTNEILVEHISESSRRYVEDHGDRHSDGSD